MQILYLSYATVNTMSPPQHTISENTFIDLNESFVSQIRDIKNKYETPGTISNRL